MGERGAGMLACSDAGWLVRGAAAGLGGGHSATRRRRIDYQMYLGGLGMITRCVSALRRRPALAGRTKCVDTLYDIRRRIGCKVVRFVRL